MSEFDSSAALSSLFRAGTVGVAMMADICCNYPLWIAAKRLGAGMPAFPGSIASLYRGGGTLWFSLGPSTMVEDKITSVVFAHTNGPYRGIISAASSGVCAALLVTSQAEHVITSSHTRSLPVLKTITTIYAEKGMTGLLLPPGMLAMVGREVPFATALFYFRPVLSTRLEKLYPNENNRLNLSRELLCGCLTSSVATPLSHPPSVIAAYQQGHSVSFRKAVRDILAIDGWKGFWRGLGARTVSLAGTFTVVPIMLHILSPLHNDLSP